MEGGRRDEWRSEEGRERGMEGKRDGGRSGWREGRREGGISYVGLTHDMMKVIMAANR